MYTFSDAVFDFSIFSLSLFVYMASIIRLHLYNIVNRNHIYKWTRRIHLFNIYGGSIFHLSFFLGTIAIFDEMVSVIFICLLLFISFNSGFFCIKQGNIRQNFFPIFCILIIITILTMNIVIIHYFCKNKSEHPAFDRYKYFVIFGASIGSVVSLSNFLYFLVYLKTKVEIVQLKMIIVREDNEKLNEDCPICLEELKIKKCIETECEHLFHEECLKASIQTAMKCPMCRRDFTVQPCL